MDSGIYVQDVKWILVPMYDLIFLMDLTTASLYFDHHHHEAYFIMDHQNPAFEILFSLSFL